MKSTVAVKMSLWYSFHWPDLNKASTGFRDKYVDMKGFTNEVS